MKALPLCIVAMANALLTTAVSAMTFADMRQEIPMATSVYAYSNPRNSPYDMQRSYPERPYGERSYEERPYGRRPYPSIDRNYDSVIGVYNSARGSLYHTYEIPCKNAPGISCEPNALCH